MNELVSVIVPTYSCEPYVRDCLWSVHSQTHERIELIIIDDCSSDGTFDSVQALLATPFVNRFENVVARRKTENLGAHHSLNLGLELATGDCIAIVNSDDLFASTRLKSLLVAMQDTGSEFAFSLVDVFQDEDAGASRPPVPEALMLLQLRQRLSLALDPCVGFALLRWNVAISTGNFVFTPRLAREVGNFAPLKYCHDWDFILRATAFTEPLALMEPLYRYRLHERNSFRGYEHLAEIETQAVYRRFFRSILRNRPENPRCPTPENWPGYFETMIRGLGLWAIWAKEAGERLSAWRTYERPYWGAVPPPGEVRSVEEAIRLLSAPAQRGAVDL